MQNIGKTDKMIRYILAAVFFSLFIILKGDLRYLALIGFIPLATAAVGVCPLYIPFGINTIEPKEKIEKHSEKMTDKKV